MFKVLFISLILVSSFSFAEDDVTFGLMSGSEFRASNIGGNVHIDCNSQNGYHSAFTYCNASVLIPRTSDYFFGPKNVKADQVVLERLDSDGKVAVRKKMAYDSKKGQTKKRVNLWIKTLFQKPLLKLGENQIQFVMYNKGEPVFDGYFMVDVVFEGSYQCKSKYYHFSYDHYCRYPSMVCEQYFVEQNYCF